MVNLNRQIRATQARQGGFSSHVLPAAVGYQVEPAWTYITEGLTLTGTGVPSTDVAFTESNTDAAVQTFEQAGGPYANAPYERVAIARTNQIPSTNCVISADMGGAPDAWSVASGLTQEGYVRVTSSDLNKSLTYAIRGVFVTGIGGIINHVGMQLIVGGNQSNNYQFGLLAELGQQFAVGSYSALLRPVAPNEGYLEGWHHYAISADAQTVRVFLDGVLIDSSAYSKFAQDRDEGFVPTRMRNLIQAGGTNWTATAETHLWRISSRCLYTTNFTPPQL